MRTSLGTPRERLRARLRTTYPQQQQRKPVVKETIAAWFKSEARGEPLAHLIGRQRAVHDGEQEEAGDEDRELHAHGAVVSVLAVLLLTGADGRLQLVLQGRQRTRGECGESARWVVRLVEVDDGLAVLRKVRIEKTPGSIGFVAARLVLEDEEERRVIRRFQHGIEPQYLALQLEHEASRAIHAVDGADDAGDRILRAGTYGSNRASTR